MNFPKHVEWIDTLPALRNFCARCRGADWIALDTEFLREKTYYPQFCLLQVATRTHIACIDTLRLTTLEPLLPYLFDPSITKIVHAGRQDLEIFYHHWGQLPAPLFDTQIAAPLTGMCEQVSYGALIAELFGVTVDKHHTRTDWTSRPLSDAQLRYAAEDVMYLGAAYEKLRDQLEVLGRLSWVEEECALLVNPSMYRNPNQEGWRRIGAAQHLRGQSLAILQDLAAWREETARTENIPRAWVVKDDTLLYMARNAPKTVEQLQPIRHLNERAVKRYGAEWCQRIRVVAARNIPIDLEPIKPRASKKNHGQEALYDFLNAIVQLKASEASLSPSLLASRKDLEQFVESPENSKLTHGWRWVAIGQELTKVLEGEYGLFMQNGQLAWKTVHEADCIGQCGL